MRAFAPRRIGPSRSSTDVNDDAHVGHRSTSVKTDHTTSIGASIVIDARSTPSFPMLGSFGLRPSGRRCTKWYICSVIAVKSIRSLGGRPLRRFRLSSAVTGIRDAEWLTLLVRDKAAYGGSERRLESPSGDGTGKRVADGVRCRR